MIFKFFSRFPSQIINITIYLPFVIFLFYCCIPSVHSEITTSSDSQFSQNLPVILELRLFSSNNCHTSYAIDCDQITLEFTTATPCYSLLSIWLEEGTLLCNPIGDFQHWSYHFEIQNHDLQDQECLRAETLLYRLFPNGYLYYGSNPSITYFAPLELCYSVYPFDEDQNLPIATDTPMLKLYANHPVQFLQPETFEQNGVLYLGLSIIDQAGNGPCCVVVPLNREQLLQSPSWSSSIDGTLPEDPISYCIPLGGIV